jgi:hypothetical protein
MNEFITVEHARVYKVAIDPKTFAIDAKETSRLRGGEKRA